MFCYIMDYFRILKSIMGEDELSRIELDCRKHENSKII